MWNLGGTSKLNKEREIIKSSWKIRDKPLLQKYLKTPVVNSFLESVKPVRSNLLKPANMNNEQWVSCTPLIGQLTTFLLP